jgi:hypothetical protein
MLTCQVPPYACSFVVSIVCSYLCDKYRKRGVMAIGSSLLAAAGYAIFLGKQHLSSKAHGDSSYNLSFQVRKTSTPTTLRSSCKSSVYIASPRALAHGTQITFNPITGARQPSRPLLCPQTLVVSTLLLFFQLPSSLTRAHNHRTGIVSTWLFMDAPRFRKATCINLSFSLAMAAFCAAVVLYLHRANARKREELARLEREMPNGEWDSRKERRRLGDRHPRFVYTL